MFEKTLLPDTLRAIKLVSKNETVKKAYLAGGTALALQIGHRISVDLDFFSTKEFNEQSLSAELSQSVDYKEAGTSWQTIWGAIGETKFSIFYYPYPLLGNTQDFKGLRIASLKDIAAMKIHALTDRGTKRDFVDIYFLSQTFSMEEMFKFYDKKYGGLAKHAYSILRAFSYFEDAQQDEMPNMLVGMDWEKVKEFFISETKRLWKDYK